MGLTIVDSLGTLLIAGLGRRYQEQGFRLKGAAALKERCGLISGPKRGAFRVSASLARSAPTCAILNNGRGAQERLQSLQQFRQTCARTRVAPGRQYKEARQAARPTL